METLEKVTGSHAILKAQTEEYEIWRKNKTKSSGTSSIFFINDFMFVEVIRVEEHSLLATSAKVLLNWLLDSV